MLHRTSAVQLRDAIRTLETFQRAGALADSGKTGNAVEVYRELYRRTVTNIRRNSSNANHQRVIVMSRLTDA